MNMFLSELQTKEVISIATGQSYGKIIDIEIDSLGNIASFLVENRKLFKKGIRNDGLSFKYSEIEKIGRDVILVRV